MSFRNMFLAVCIVLGSLALSSASQAAPATEFNALEGTVQSRMDQYPTPASGEATASVADSSYARRRKPRLMTTAFARRNALDQAEYIYTDPEATWSGYGVSTCDRITRSKVSCFSYVYEDYYVEGLYDDTIYCGWDTVSYYPRYGRARTWLSEPYCAWGSEL